MSTVDTQATGTREDPVYFKFLYDSEGTLDVKRVAFSLVVVVLSGYLAAKSQRWGAQADNPAKELKMRVAQSEITIGNKLCRLGKSIEESGWERYERAALCK